MKLHVYSVYDKAVRGFLPPMFFRAEGEALRAFNTAVNSADHQFNRFSTDYVLFRLGEFDDASGLFGTGEPIRVISAAECLVSPNPAGPVNEPAASRGNGAFSEEKLSS